MRIIQKKIIQIPRFETDEALLSLSTRISFPLGKSRIGLFASFQRSSLITQHIPRTLCLTVVGIPECLENARRHQPCPHRSPNTVGDRCSGSDGHMRCDSGKQRAGTENKVLEIGNAQVGPFKAECRH